MSARRGREQAQFRVARFPEAMRYAARVMLLVFDTSPALTLLLGGLTILAAMVPAAQVWTFKQIMDLVGVALTGQGGTELRPILTMLLLNILAQLTGSGARSAIAAVRGTLGDLFSNRTNLMILTKSESLDISYFENPAFYDRLENAQREAREGPVQIVNEAFSLVQSAITLIMMIGLLFTLSWWVVAVVLATTGPGLVVEAHVFTRALPAADLSIAAGSPVGLNSAAGSWGGSSETPTRLLLPAGLPLAHYQR